MKPIRNENYTCSICNIQKTDTESRQSFDKHYNPICWECQQIISINHEQKIILRNIQKLQNKYEKLEKEKSSMVQKC